MLRHPVIIQRRHTKITKNSSLLPKNYLREFSSITSLHGIMYLGEPKRPLLERVYWLCVMSLVVSLCGWEIYHLWNGWSSNRMIMTINNNAYDISSVPFPAITFCNDLQLQNINNRNTTDDEEINDAINVFCYKHNFQNNTTLSFINLIKWQNLIKNHKISCQQIISKLYWLEYEIQSPCDYIQPSFTSYGLCYSLNMIPQHHFYKDYYFQTMHFLNPTLPDNVFHKNNTVWTPENHYSKNATPFDIPWKVTGTTIENNVRLIFNLKNTYSGGQCPDTDPGITIIVHNPADSPIGMKPTAYVTHNSIMSVSIYIMMVYASSQIVNWLPKERKCYFQNEKILKYFKIYTIHNCEIECKANNTLNECGCNAYFQPRDPDVPVCGSKSFRCVRESMSTGYSIFEKQPENLSNNLDNCMCLPACVDILYEYETVEFFKNRTINTHSLNKNENAEDKSVLMAYYKRKYVVSLPKSPAMSFNELLGNIGGLFGLFLGGSIISFFEIIYFFIIRLFFNRRDQRIAKSKILPNIILDE